jgi:hypothetical protein
MQTGDLAKTMISGEIVIILQQVGKKVWNVLRTDGRVTSEWVLNLVPYEDGK